MRTSSRQFPRISTGFTLIEMLVVVSIIGILAGLLLPVLAAQKTKTKITQARTEMANLAAAINQYYATYSRLPTSLTPAAGDATFGLATDPDFALLTIYNNSDLMVILGNFDVGVNANSAKNPQRVNFLPNIKAAATTGLPGLGPDNIYRDPWGQPYIITLDLDADDQCDDGFYWSGPMPPVLLSGLYGRVRAPVAIWSKGPDGRFDRLAAPGTGANQKHIFSWK